MAGRVKAKPLAMPWPDHGPGHTPAAPAAPPSLPSLPLPQLLPNCIASFGVTVTPMKKRSRHVRRCRRTAGILHATVASCVAFLPEPPSLRTHVSRRTVPHPCATPRNRGDTAASRDLPALPAQRPPRSPAPVCCNRFPAAAFATVAAAVAAAILLSHIRAQPGRADIKTCNTIHMTRRGASQRHRETRPSMCCVLSPRLPCGDAGAVASACSDQGTRP